MSAKAQLYQEQVKKAKKVKSGKRSGPHVAKSRKPWRMANRAAVRDSKRSYRCVFICAADLRSFRAYAKGEYNPPPPTQRQRKSDAERRADEIESVDLVSSDEETEDARDFQGGSDNVIVLSSDDEDEETDFTGPARWPTTVERVPHAVYPPHILLKDFGSVDWCGCVGACVVDVCPNAVTGVFAAEGLGLIGLVE